MLERMDRCIAANLLQEGLLRCQFGTYSVDTPMMRTALAGCWSGMKKGVSGLRMGIRSTLVVRAV